MRLLLVVGLCAAAFLLCGFGPPRLIDNDAHPLQRVDPASLPATTLQQAVTGLTATAALVYERDVGQLLFERNGSLALPPASLTKLMTALLTHEQAKLGDLVIVDAADLVGGASMGLQVGEQVTVADLLRGLLIPSGNDAAMALSRHVAGGEDAFVVAMNARADQLGLAQTHFENPHGFDAEGHLSSARDILMLTLANWQDQFFREIVATKSTTVAGHALRNTNDLLGPLISAPGARAIGVKTGTTSAAGQCLVAAVERDGHLTLIVVLASSDRYKDVQMLYNAVQERQRWVSMNAGDSAALNRAVAQDGSTLYLRALGESPAAFLEGWQAPMLRAVRWIDGAMVQQAEAGSVVGRIEWWLGRDKIGEQLLAAR